MSWPRTAQLIKGAFAGLRNEQSQGAALRKARNRRAPALRLTEVGEMLSMKWDGTRDRKTSDFLPVFSEHHWLIGFVTYIEYSLCSRLFLLAAFRTEQMKMVNKAGNAAVIDYRFHRDSFFVG